MARWGLLLDNPAWHGEYKPMELLATVDGTRESAEAQLRELVRLYRPSNPTKPKRTRIYRTVDGWALICDGALGQSFPYRFMVCELEWDSGPADEPKTLWQ
ncbi:hypothetical protein [Streptomyces sp. H27-C3]|uniref:hypothetical protein n=1 Tax=Streptomyces sp. H27-C3 TaxID=3046305 RepID=UPI0024B8C6AC|nr:hypothetical protein [Streptomyces sp. H27-C3]MDJ0464725.1 hypothetical protein [Streptomyces sp. H27-C3]